MAATLTIIAFDLAFIFVGVVNLIGGSRWVLGMILGRRQDREG